MNLTSNTETPLPTNVVVPLNVGASGVGSNRPAETNVTESHECGKEWL